MKLFKIGMFSAGLLGGVATTFAGGDCCCCGSSCNKVACHKNGCCSCCLPEYGKCEDRCCKKECKKDKFQKRHSQEGWCEKESKSIIKTIDLKDKK